MFKGKDKNVSSTFSKLLQAYKVMNFNGKELYVMGIERIIKFSAEEVVLLLKNAQKLCICRQLHRAACISAHGRAANFEPNAGPLRGRGRGVPQTAENTDIFICGSHCARAEFPAHKAASAPPPMSAVRAPYHVRLA